MNKNLKAHFVAVYGLYLVKALFIQTREPIHGIFAKSLMAKCKGISEAAAVIFKLGIEK